MVSRAGRSKGCSNCRRRRVKCDENRPACNRCTKRGVVCDGPREATWINHTTPNPKPSNVQAVNTVPASLSCVAFQDELSIAFTREHLLRGGHMDMAWDKIQARRVPDGSPVPGLNLLQNAILSLSVIFFGRRHGQLALESRGYVQYGSVLRELNAHMSDIHFELTDSIILASATCMLLEIFLPTGPSNYLKHLRGIEAMLEKRGPPEWSTCEFALIVHHLWAVCIVGALIEGRPSLLAKREWKSVPPVHLGQDTVLKHHLWVLLADYTLVTSERDSIIAAGTHRESQQLQSLVRTLEGMLRRLQIIYLEWQVYNACLRDDGIPKVDLNLASPFGNHASATAYMLCKTARLYVLRLIQSIRPTPNQSRLLLATTTDILRCLELEYFRKRQGNAESNTIGFLATKLVWETVGGLSSSEGKKLATFMREAADSGSLTSAWEYVRSKMVEHNTHGVYDAWLGNGAQGQAHEAGGMEPDAFGVGRSALVRLVGPPDARRPCSEDWLPGVFVCSETPVPPSTVGSAATEISDKPAGMDKLLVSHDVDPLLVDVFHATMFSHPTNCGDVRSSQEVIIDDCLAL